MSESQQNTRPDRSVGSIGIVLLITIVLVGAAVILLLVGRGIAGPYILALLALLAVVGVFSLFSLATGILRFSSTNAASMEGLWRLWAVELPAVLLIGFAGGVLTLMASTSWVSKYATNSWNVVFVSMATLCLGFGVAAVFYGRIRDAQGRALREQYDELRTRADVLSKKFDSFEKKKAAR